MVIISRTDPRDVGQRQIYVRIDDGPTYTLLFGETVSESLPPGIHRLRANNTLFWKSVSFTIEVNEQHDDVEFSVINAGGAFATGMIAILGVAPLSLLIERGKPSSLTLSPGTRP